MSVAYTTSSATAKNGAATAEFTVRRSGTSLDLGTATSVDFSTADVTAKAGDDYVATSGALKFSAGQAELVVPVEILDDAYTSSTTTTFIFTLANFGTATGTIVPEVRTNTTQTYLYLPEDDDSVAVPTSEKPGGNLMYQAVYSGFSDPTEPAVEMPLGYLRIGHARSDMNDYERAVVNSAAYVPAWKVDGTDTTRPVEMGPLIHMMLPRGLSRLGLSKDEVADEMQENAHLDGVFLHSDKNWIVTVGNHKNEVIQGDSTQYVGGRVRANFMGPEARWSYMDGPNKLRSAQGTDKVNGQIWSYAISTCRNLSINCDWTINYRLGKSFTASASADLTVSNAAKYDVSNSIAMEVKGLEAAISCNIKGEYNVNLPGFSRATTEMEFSKEAIESITLSVNPATAIPRSTQVAGLAMANAAAAMAATSAGWIMDFASDGTFYSNVNAEELSTAYNDSFTDVIPDALGGLAALTAVFVMLTAVQQQAEALVPSVTPKISMTPEALTLSCGASSIVLNEEGIFIGGGELNVYAGDAEVETIGGLDLISGGAITLEANAVEVIGPLTVLEDITALSDIVAAATVFAAFVETA